MCGRMAFIDTCFLILIRMSVVLGVASLAAIMLFMTPLPENSHANCNRPCHELEWPMICRFHFIIEARRTLNRKACKLCLSNATECLKKSCLVGDGSDRRIFTANKQYPGPNMHVCENDILVVGVENRLAGHSVTLHWRGQPLHETPSMDGVPMVTQCPVSAHTTFQYKIRASQAGTHFWQAMTGDPDMDDLFGALVVRRSNKLEPQRTLYDEDLPDHLILLSEWSDSDKSVILINGRANAMEGNLLPAQVYNVTKGKRYRFRVAYATSHSGCPISAEISSHSIFILALDGHSIQPKKVDSFSIVPGERIDFVLSADQKINHYKIKFKTSDWCWNLNAESYAILTYNNSDPSSNLIKESPGQTVLTTVKNTNCQTPEKVCLSALKSLQSMKDKMRNSDMEVKLKFVLQRLKLSWEQEIENEDDYLEHVMTLNNLTFAFPSSPLLLRHDDVSDDDTPICNQQKVPAMCSTNLYSCHCTHVVPVPLMASVQITILNPDESNGGSDRSYVFHLHGHPFYVIHRGELQNVTAAINEDNSNTNPVLKDTISIPSNSFAILRFVASNSGYWFLHESRPQLWSRGMAVVLKVGERENFPHVPDDFPTCGNWIGPEFFLA